MSGTSEARPAFSVIVPVFGQPSQLAGCLEALSALRTPSGGFEVIIVDDGSPEPFDVVVEPYRPRLNLTLVRQPNRGPGAARNAGAAVARGRCLAFTDCDCWPAPAWLTLLEEGFSRAPDQMLGGRTMNRLARNAYAATSQLIVDVVYVFYNRDAEDARFFASNNVALPAAQFRAMGGFDHVRFPLAGGEDRDLCDRWRHAGHRLTYIPTAVVRHAHDLTFTTFCRQHFSYGRGAWVYQRVRAERDSGRLRDDLTFHIQLPRLLGRPLASLPRRQVPAVVILLAVWQVANAVGFFYEARRSTRR